MMPEARQENEVLLPGGQAAAAIVVAAGYSSRMKAFKPLLPLGEGTVLEAAIGCLRRAGVTEILVVLGHRAEEVKPVVEQAGACWIYNEQYDDGMYSSVCTGVQALQRRIDLGGCLLLPADMPLIKTHTVKTVLRFAGQVQADVVYPVFQGRRGHPPFLSARLFPAMLHWNGTGGLRGFLAGQKGPIQHVPVLDEGIVLDMDAPDEYTAICGRYDNRMAPTVRECEAILQYVQSPPAAVAAGRQLADAVRRRGDGIPGSVCAAAPFGWVAAAGMLAGVLGDRSGRVRAVIRLLHALGYAQTASCLLRAEQAVRLPGRPAGDDVRLLLTAWGDVQSGCGRDEGI